MGRQLVKPVREEDFYVLWSSVIDGPVAWGTREEMYAYLETPRRGELWMHDWQIEEDLASADKHGTSSESQFGETWGCVVLRFGGQHNVKREDLKALCTVIARHPAWTRSAGWQALQDDPEAARLLTDIRDT